MDKQKVALVGCGRISYKHIEALVNNYETSILVAVCDIIEERAEEKGNMYVNLIKEKYNQEVNVNVYIDYNHMYELENIDLVAIATESGNHYQHTIDALNMGKHVIVEKPIALSNAHADEMIFLAKEKGLKLCVSHQNRFNPPIQRLRTAVEEGRFGKIYAANARVLWNRDKNYYDQASWRGTYALDGGCLMNQCIHNIDLMQWILGSEVDCVNAMLDNYNHDYIEAEDYGSLQVRFKNGSIGNVEGTVVVYPKNLEETLTVLGEKGTVVIGGLAVNEIKTWQFADEKDDFEQVSAETKSEIANVYGNGHTALYTDMIDAIKSNRKPYIDGNDGRVAMSIILEAYNKTKEDPYHLINLDK